MQFHILTLGFLAATAIAAPLAAPIADAELTITRLEKRDPLSRQRCMACRGGKNCKVVSCDSMADRMASKFTLLIYDGLG
jgi:hypothetical protein